jgi:DNA-binding response OmpR family regulator
MALRQPAHVLVAEDNALVSSAMRILFEESGFRVSVTPSVMATVAVASTDPVDVLLLDLGLADGDGLLALTELRALDRLPRMSVALTGRDDSGTVERCRAAGCAAVLLKPVPARELIAKVKSWVGDAGHHDEG